MTKKIKSLSELESELMAASVVEDVRLPDNTTDVTQDENKIINADDVRRDVSVFARTIIRGYCGWPFHTEILKRKILTGLKKIHDTATDMKASELFDKFSKIIEIIPDNHISVILGKSWGRTKFKKTGKDVGKNIAPHIEKIRMEKRGKIAIVAIPTLSLWKDEEISSAIKKFPDFVKDSDALIIDLRGNGGGNSRPIESFAEYLYGAETFSCKRSYIRTTPEAKIIQSSRPNSGWANVNDKIDPGIWLNSYDKEFPKFASKGSGYKKPIYVLTDKGVCSSAEMFITMMKKHPYIKLVGENTSGCEVFGSMFRIFLPTSKISLRIGNVYRELEQENFELNGYRPDIICKDGQDALAVALADYGKSLEQNNQVQKEK